MRKREFKSENGKYILLGILLSLLLFILSNWLEVRIILCFLAAYLVVSWKRKGYKLKDLL